MRDLSIIYTYTNVYTNVYTIRIVHKVKALVKVIVDIETNSLINPTKVWLIVCKDVDRGEWNVFYQPTERPEEGERFLAYSRGVDLWIGHNWLGFDWPCLRDLLGLRVDDVAHKSVDTLVVSRLAQYPRRGNGPDEVTYVGHSIESYGIEFGLGKIAYSDFTQLTPKMEEYCRRDVAICEKIYNKYLKIINSEKWKSSLLLEHEFQLIVNDLHDKGFHFDKEKADKLLLKVTEELSTLDEKILSAFPPRLKLIKEIHPRLTRYGTLNKSDFRFVKDGVLDEYNGGPFSRCKWVSFNPSSHKQIIDVLSESGWVPVDKTKTHTEAERPGSDRNGLDLDHFKRYGWKINETNLSTLPETAPSPARLLAKRILLESRRRTLTEWLSLVREDGRIHGKFYGIGAWTHRMAHQQPNTANIPTEGKLYGHEMRSLWRAPKNRLLVGVDAEAIQLRIFAHYIDDKEFTESLVSGKKADKTDPHSLNATILHTSREKAKRFLYAFLLGAGSGKLAEILDLERQEGEALLAYFIKRYPGLAELKGSIIPTDAKRGYFVGLDGRNVSIPGDTAGERRHLCMSGYLQNGEAIVVKRVCVKLKPVLDANKSFFVDIVHDETQKEVPNDKDLAIMIAKKEADFYREVGEELKLKCPLTGSYWNEDLNKYSIGTNWSKTH